MTIQQNPNATADSPRASRQKADPSRPWYQASEPVMRPVGLETEFGIIEPGNPYANPVAMASQIVAAYAEISRSQGPAVRWDYEGEDPLADMRGGRLDRASAHPSMLTDDPLHPSPSAEAHQPASPCPQPRAHTTPSPRPTQGETETIPGDGVGNHTEPELPPAPWGTRPRPSAAQAALPRATTVVLTNGARLYVDHAHPEYSSPEVLTPRDAVAWDRAGEAIARLAMAAHAAQTEHHSTDGGKSTRPDAGDTLHAGREPIVLYKNNVDGKGAAYGSHENYLVRRDLPFDSLAAAMIPFLITRPIIAGAGRVGIGQRGQRPGFQISARADYIENDIGLQTTFNRPIVNTRDEPHAESATWRRFHVINGDANHFEIPIFLKVATTNLLLWYLEQAHARGLGLGELADLALTGDPVEHCWAISHDPTLRTTIPTACGPRTALQIQRTYWQVIADAVQSWLPDPFSRDTAPHTHQALQLWDKVLSELEAYASCDPQELPQAMAQAARSVEWLAKYQVCQALRTRSGLEWDDARLAALDIQWADLRDGKGIAETLNRSGRTQRILCDDDITHAVTNPPLGTRAWIRGKAIASNPYVVGASWTSLLIDHPSHDALIRLSLPGQVTCSQEEADALLEAAASTISVAASTPDTPGQSGTSERN